MGVIHAEIFNLTKTMRKSIQQQKNVIGLNKMTKKIIYNAKNCDKIYWHFCQRMKKRIKETNLKLIQSEVVSHMIG